MSFDGQGWILAHPRPSRDEVGPLADGIESDLSVDGPGEGEAPVGRSVEPRDRRGSVPGRRASDRHPVGRDGPDAAAPRQAPRRGSPARTRAAGGGRPAGRAGQGSGVPGPVQATVGSTSSSRPPSTTTRAAPMAEMPTLQSGQQGHECRIQRPLASRASPQGAAGTTARGVGRRSLSASVGRRAARRMNA